MKAIEARALTKVYKVSKHKEFWRRLFTPSFRNVIAVDGIDFDVEKGETVGFVGPNGAGKSTTIKILTGVLVPTSGQVQVNGIDPHRNRIENARRVGVVFGQRSQLWWDLPGRDSLNLIKYIYKIATPTFERNLAIFDDLLDLGSFMNTPVRQMSLGQRMRMDIAAALIHEPEIIYLDEPTIGLDVNVKEKIRSFIDWLNREKGATIFFTTHDMQDIERNCTRIVIIDHGRIVYDGAIAEFRRQYGGQSSLTVELKSEVPDFHLEGAEVYRHTFCKRWLHFSKEHTPVAKLVAELIAKYDVLDFSIQDTGIDVILRRLYETSRR